MENEIKKQRVLPILLKHRESYLKGNLGYYKDELAKKYYKIEDDPKLKTLGEYSSYHDGTLMEVCVVNVTKDEDKIPHYSLLLRETHDKGKVLYSSKERRGYRNELMLDPLTTDVEYDIVKNHFALFLLLTAAILHDDTLKKNCKSLQENFFRDMLDDCKILIDSIDVDLEDATPEFVEWFQTVSSNLLEAFYKVQIDLNDVITDAVYIVYGEFDPITRKDLRNPEGEKDEDDD